MPGFLLIEMESSKQLTGMALELNPSNLCLLRSHDYRLTVGVGWSAESTSENKGGARSITFSEGKWGKE
jgi:hypothetical protein